MRRVLAVLATAGCGFTPGTFTPPEGDAGDAASDDATDAPSDVAIDAVGAYCGMFVASCPSSLPQMPLVLTSMTIDTGNSGMCDPSVANACLVAAASITLPSGETVTGVGARPLVLFAWPGDITIQGTLSVASQRTTTIGAGSALGPCGAAVAATGNGGGAGGSFGALGGSGGGGTMGTLGTPGAAQVLSSLRGGCPGADGAGTNAGVGRPGGGVVDLIASSIVVDGTINASGMGGDAATTSGNGAGGGGGGSGGAIVFDTPQLAINAGAQIFANGGSGGEGASSTGGNGQGEQCQASTCGGGGGGGGAGVIKTTDPTPPAPSTSTMSPAFS